MSKNYLQFDFGGKILGAKFNNRTINIIGELTGVDPLTFVPKSETWTDLLAYTGVLFHAALLSNLATKKEDPDFDAEQVKEWLLDMDTAQVYYINQVYQQSLNPTIVTANGEVGKDTQPGATVVATT
jgi:hypothetical protein